MDIKMVFLYCALGLVVLVLTKIIVRSNEIIKEKTYILKELKKIKELFENNRKLEYTSNGIKIYTFIYSFIILIAFNPMLLIIIFIYFDSQLMTIGIILLMVIVDILIVYLIHYILNKNVKSILIKGDLLIIKYNDSIKEYSISNIERLKTRISYTRRGGSFLYLYIKNKDDDKYDGYFLKSYKETNIIALVILINYLKQNSIYAIDTLTEEDIEKFIDKIKIKDKSQRLKDEEIRHIVL